MVQIQPLNRDGAIGEIIRMIFIDIGKSGN